MPLRRYQTPSRVRQTSSASIFPPLVNRITGRPPSLLPIPGPLVETGAVVERECEVAIRSGLSFGVAEADGAGDAVSIGAGATTIARCGAGTCSALATEAVSIVLGVREARVW